MVSPNWYAVRTKPSQEKRATENLSAWGMETLAPWLPPKKGNPFPRPLFPGYIFARCEQTMLQKLHFTRGILFVVSFGGKAAVVEDEVITAIRSRTDDRGVICPGPALTSGDTVLIQSGPLRGLVGVFEKEIPGTERVRILLTIVAYSARVEISRSNLLKISRHSPEVA